MDLYIFPVVVLVTELIIFFAALYSPYSRFILRNAGFLFAVMLMIFVHAVYATNVEKRSAGDYIFCWWLKDMEQGVYYLLVTALFLSMLLISIARFGCVTPVFLILAFSVCLCFGSLGTTMGSDSSLFLHSSASILLYLSFWGIFYITYQRGSNDYADQKMISNIVIAIVAITGIIVSVLRRAQMSKSNEHSSSWDYAMSVVLYTSIISIPMLILYQGGIVPLNYVKLHDHQS